MLVKPALARILGLLILTANHVNPLLFRSNAIECWSGVGVVRSNAAQGDHFKSQRISSKRLGLGSLHCLFLSVSKPVVTGHTI